MSEYTQSKSLVRLMPLNSEKLCRNQSCWHLCYLFMPIQISSTCPNIISIRWSWLSNRTWIKSCERACLFQWT